MQTLLYILSKYHIPDASKKVEIPDMNRLDLARLFEELGFKTGVEVGTERGVYAKELLERAPSVHLHCVDPWKAYHGYREHVSQEKLDGFYLETVERLKRYNAMIIREFSLKAADIFANNSIDFVYIDGNHAYEHVVADLAAWVPKVKKGGIVAGHDYLKRVNPEYLMGVVPAVDGWCDAYQVEPLFIVGSKEIKESERRDKQRSWFFVK